MKRRHNHYATLLIVLLLLVGPFAHAAVWQWSVPVKPIGVNKDPSRAFLWIPPNCKQVKTVIFAQNNMEEQSILEDPGFRKEMDKLGVAEIWV
ncbi:MAG TPA: hypothetical protein VF500_29005, partial [Mucilaginibacter sp.]